MPRQVSTPRTSEDGKLLLEVTGARVPKGYEPVHGKHSDANKFETTMGREGHIFMASLDGQIDTLGITDDAESASGNGTVVAILKRIRTLLGQVVLAAGTAIIGKVGIDQTTDGTTNRVVAKISQTAGENVVAVTSSALPTGAATSARQDTIIGHVDGLEGAVGTISDAESGTGENGTFIAIIKRVRTLLTAVFEAIITPGAAIGTSKAIQVAGSDGTNVRTVKTTSDGTVLTQLTGSILQDAVTLQNNVSADGNGAAATVAGLATAVFQVSGTFVANINFEASIDGVTFVPLTVTHVGNGGIFTVANAPALYRASISGLSHIRARVSGRSSGNVTVTVRNTVTVTANKHVSTQGRFDLRGLAASRPLPATVPLGAIYLSVDTRAIDMSNGTSWVSLGVI